MKTPRRFYQGYVFDLDGTLYLDERLLPSVEETVRELKTRARVLYVTNKPLETPADYAARLTRLGIPTRTEEVISSTDALLDYLAGHPPAAKVFVIGEEPLIRTFRAAGYAVTDQAEGVDVVVVSFDRTFDYRKLQTAFDAVRHGARIVATNPDPYCPTEDGGLPDCAAMLAAVEACTGARAEAVTGKPSIHMATAILNRLGVSPENALMTGDRITTDIRMARTAGMASALVMTGATRPEDLAASPEQPDYVLDSLGDLIPANVAKHVPSLSSSSRKQAKES